MDINLAEELEVLEVAEQAERYDFANRRGIEAALRQLLPDDSIGKESTMEAFKRLTNQQPWIPFRAGDSTIPATDIDKEEAILFDEMEKNFDCIGDAPPYKSYHAFEKEWNQLATRRFKEWCNGNEAVIIPRLKSAVFLQDHFHKRNQLRSLEAVLPRIDDPDRDRMDEVFRDNRRSLPRTPQVHVVTPTVFYANGTAPYGHPLTLNADVTVFAVNGFNNNNNNLPFHAPYRMNLPNLPPVRPPPKRLRVFRSRRFCKSCGWLRSVHNQAKEGVGDSCRRSFCGKCYRMKNFHKDHSGMVVGFGPNCTNDTNRLCTGNVEEWYTNPVSYLASFK